MNQLQGINQLQVLGKQTVAGIEFTGIEGGFGEGKKAMLVKDIAGIHKMLLKNINSHINTNRNKFKDNIDIIDLRNCGSFSKPQFEDIGFSKMQVSKAKNIYLLSERGYAKLLKILEDDLAWELYDKLVDEYFQMRVSQPQIDYVQLSQCVATAVTQSMMQIIPIVVDSINNQTGPQHKAETKKVKKAELVSNWKANVFLEALTSYLGGGFELGELCTATSVYK